ncbi:MAG: dihydrolipoamide dehydrogenase precursor [Watsoniomyces obsoletus]|nr:MAG: dihydrolipoamide dehydrogenase precursor [Watsoniomyces obsoletus]
MHLVHLVQSLALAHVALAVTNAPNRGWRSLVRRADNDTAAAGGNATDPSPYATIVPSETLKWTPCLEDLVNQATAANLTASKRRFECARLLVPYDYEQGNASAGQFSLAVIRSQAVDRSNYKGPMFVNFGGPGGSGTSELLGKLLGPGAKTTEELLKDYDVVSWDPRGVGSTLPALTCYSAELARTFSSLNIIQASLYGSNDSLVRLDAENQVRARGCVEHSGDILPYVGTLYAAQDLRRLVESYGHCDKLSYIGFSYGTLLGAFYAALYPDKIERMILDAAHWIHIHQGVIDPTYATQEIFNPKQYVDPDKILEDFFNWCFLAGKERCEFWYDSPSAIRDAFFKLDNRLHEQPFPVPSKPDGWVLSWAQFRSALFQLLYNPLDEFPGIATQLAQLTNGTYNTAIADAPKNPFDLPHLTDPIKKMKNGAENTPVITCADRPNWSMGDNLKEVDAYLRSKEVTDPTIFGSYLVGYLSLLCSRLPTNTTKRFTGSFKDITTSKPILFVSTLHDPVTPLHMAYSASSGFIGSSVLINNITQHCGLAQMSECTTNAVRAYLTDATLPENGTMCQPQLLPWGLLPEGGFAPDGTTVEGLLSAEASPGESKKKTPGAGILGSSFD